jgi:imidazole glycerol-phosphate synthase subunit HisF
MLKKRIIANVVVKDGIVVQSIGFNKYLPVGRPAIAIEFLNQWGIDEIMLTDISATINRAEPAYEVIRHAAKKCQVPLTISGGIYQVEQMKRLMQCGADKISLNTAALGNPQLITDAAHIFGDQCVVVSIDAVKRNNTYQVYHHSDRKALDLKPEKWAAACQEAGAGEIFIQAVDRDGMYNGFDLDLTRSVCDAVSIPVIACGGARTANDFVEVFQNTGASAACAANMFHFTEHSVNITKAQVLSHLPVRLETHATYSDSPFNSELRLDKKSDKVLEEMLYTRIEKEII